MSSLDELLSQARELAPLPASTVRLAALVGSRNADLQELCEVIAYDQSLTMALLRAANSAAHAGVSDVSQVYEAVFRLGSGRVLAVAMSASTGKMMKQRLPAYDMDEGDLWRHSVAAVAAAESIFEFAAEDLPPESFTTALLHDVGKLVMGRYLTESDLKKIHRARTDGGLTLLAAEGQVLGIHHAELGGVIARHWNLPEPIVKGITFHHAPAAGLDLTCDVACLANHIAKRVENVSPLPDWDVVVLGNLGIGESQLEDLTRAARANFEIVKARYRAG